MADWAVYGLLALALVVPVLGALLLRLIADRLSEVQGAIAVAVLVGVAIISVLILARSEVTNLGVGSLNVLRPATSAADSPLPPEPTAWGEPPVAFVPDEVAPIIVETVTATASPTATRTVTGTRTVTTTRTTRPTTPTLTATPTLTPTLTATSSPTTNPTEAVRATLEAIRQTQQAGRTATPTPAPTATPEPPTATPEPPPEPPAQQVYVVEPGDTLRGIAEAFGVSVEALLDANDLTPEEADQIRPGQELIIP